MLLFRTGRLIALTLLVTALMIVAIWFLPEPAPRIAFWFGGFVFGFGLAKEAD